MYLYNSYSILTSLVLLLLIIILRIQMYDKLVFPFIIPPKKLREEWKEKEGAKPILNPFYNTAKLFGNLPWNQTTSSIIPHIHKKKRCIGLSLVAGGVFLMTTALAPLSIVYQSKTIYYGGGGITLLGV